MQRSKSKEVSFLSIVGNKLLKAGIIVFGISMALSLAYGTAWAASKILLPDHINVDAILIGVPFYKKILYSVAMLGCLSGTFFGLYVVYLLFKSAVEDD